MSKDDASAALHAARNEERRALAETLHDGLTQTLTAARAYLDAYQLTRERRDEEKAARQLARGMELLDASVAELRRVIRDLRGGLPESRPAAALTAQAVAPSNGRAGGEDSTAGASLPPEEGGSE